MWRSLNPAATRLHKNLHRLLFSECRHLPTKSKMYRWIVLESHLIIYRITIKEVQVLRILHSNRSITKIRTSRGVRL
jgi:hypothetical protein